VPWLLSGGVVLIIVGSAWGAVFPINKNLGTSSTCRTGNRSSSRPEVFMADAPRAVEPGVRIAEPPSRLLLGLPRPVWLLGLGSLLTDTASEAIYPLLPIFLTRVLGGTAFSLGLIEGVAEAANSLLKVLSGHVSDRWNRRKPIVLAGYSLSSAVRPLISLVTSWPQVLLIRFTDRVGKGVRGAPRDAMLAGCATPETRGRVFGFHRAMDHVGAILGPTLATLFLLAWPGEYRTLFLVTLVPGALAVWMLSLVREDGAGGASRRGAAPRSIPAPGQAPASEARERMPRGYYAFLVVLLLFTLGNSADAFLLLRLTDLGIRPVMIPLLWAALHVVKASVSVVGGPQSDRIGRRSIIGIGWIVYALVYGGFAAASSPTTLIVCFLIYGFYYGFAEGTEKAFIADLAPASLRGTAFGVYNAVLGVGSFVASVLFGLIWKQFGAPTAFATGAVLALGATVLLFVSVQEHRPVRPSGP
jgi:MFS family permease